MKSIFLFFALITVYVIDAQEPVKKNSAYLELGGAGMTFSVNYQRLFYQFSGNKLEARIGVGYFPLYVNNNPVFGTLNKLLGINYLHSLGNHHAEASFTTCIAETFDESVARDKFSKTSYIFSPSLGYRYQNFSKNSIVLKAAWAPMVSFYGISPETKKIFFKNYILLGIGYSF